MRCRTGRRAISRVSAADLPLPPLLEARMVFDGYRIVREIHALEPQPHLSRRRYRNAIPRSSSRSRRVDLRDDAAYLKRFMMEEWVARRINNAHVLKPVPAVAQAQLPLCRHRIRRRPDADAVDDRQSEAGPGDGARHHRADRQGPARVSPHGNAASGSAARQHHDRPHRHGEDHRLRLDQGCRRRRGRRRSRATTFWAPRSTPRRNTFSARAARRAPTCFRSASSPIRCSPGNCPTARRWRGRERSRSSSER